VETDGGLVNRTFSFLLWLWNNCITCLPLGSAQYFCASA